MTQTTTEKAGTGAKILAELQELRADIRQVFDLLTNPNDLRFYRASTQDLAKGKALKIDLRISPAYNERGFLDPKRTEGGVFVEIAPQKTLKTRSSDATFDWESPEVVKSKLSSTDLAAFILLLRSRWVRYKIPDKYLAKDQSGAIKPNTIALFHKVQGTEERAASSSAIEFATLTDDGCKLYISKSAALRKDFVLSLLEEIELGVYLERSLGALQAYGL